MRIRTQRFADFPKLQQVEDPGGEILGKVAAPLGWAENIASQFVDERDYGGQTISYKPDISGEEEKES